MEATRRSIMGILGGAVAAGPALAEKIVSEVANVGALVAPVDEANLAKALYTGNMALPQTSGPTDWGFDRIREIKRMLRGSDVELAQQNFPSGYDIGQNIVDLHIESLRSVSPANKRRIRTEAEQRRSAERRRRELTEELASLLTGGWSKKFGGGERLW